MLAQEKLPLSPDEFFSHEIGNYSLELLRHMGEPDLQV